MSLSSHAKENQHLAGPTVQGHKKGQREVIQEGGKNFVLCVVPVRVSTSLIWMHTCHIFALCLFLFLFFSYIPLFKYFFFFFFKN